MGVGVERHADLRVTQTLLNCLRMHAVGQEKRGRRVPQVVKMTAPQRPAPGVREESRKLTFLSRSGTGRRAS